MLFWHCISLSHEIFCVDFHLSNSSVQALLFALQKCNLFIQISRFDLVLKNSRVRSVISAMHEFSKIAAANHKKLSKNFISEISGLYTRFKTNHLQMDISSSTLQSDVGLGYFFDLDLDEELQLEKLFTLEVIGLKRNCQTRTQFWKLFIQIFFTFLNIFGRIEKFLFTAHVFTSPRGFEITSNCRQYTDTNIRDRLKRVERVLMNYFLYKNFRGLRTLFHRWL